MILTRVRVSKYRNILDSTDVLVQPDVTCFVGKNESGKTAFFQALYRLMPARPNAEFSLHEQYPAWLEKHDRQREGNLEGVQPVLAEFEFGEDDLALVEQSFGMQVITGKHLTLARSYGGELEYIMETVAESAYIGYLLNEFDLPSELRQAAEACVSISEFRSVVSEWSTDPEGSDSEVLQIRDRINGRLATVPREGRLDDAIWNVVEKRVPRFFYFTEYSKLPYSVNIAQVLRSKPDQLSDSDQTAKSLLRLASAEEAYLLNPDYERRKRELENAANAITHEVLGYWTTNPHLRVQPDITTRVETKGQGQQVVLDELKLRIWDDRHMLTLRFDEHSTGFQWFFSFLAAFSEFENHDPPPVILLDEPALGLHARAQADFLQFIDERLAARQQVLYSTHSPFMIQPGKLERVRIVEDTGRERGAIVTADVLSTDQDTLFPLQGALGYDLVQHLFIAPHNLIVEGTSDFTYLQVLSNHLKSLGGREYLDERWSLVPVGGIDLIPTFVALLGGKLDITVVIDSQRKGHQRLQQLAADGYLSNSRIISVGQALKTKFANIEDLFSPGDYLRLFNRAFSTQIKVAELQGTDSVISQVARCHGVDQYNHGEPADVLLRHRDELLPKFTDQTLRQFGELFRLINATLQQ